MSGGWGELRLRVLGFVVLASQPMHGSDTLMSGTCVVQQQAFEGVALLAGPMNECGLHD